ncbi:hypothetical protein D3C74_375960 [compost metagenome]
MIVRNRNQIALVNHIKKSIMMLVFLTVKRTVLAIRVRSIIEGIVVYPYMCGAVNCNAVIFRIPIACAAVRWVPLRKIIVGILELNITDNDIICPFF